MDDAQATAPARGAVGIGALAVGNVKYQVQHRLLVRMREADKPRRPRLPPRRSSGAREVLAEPAAG